MFDNVGRESGRQRKRQVGAFLLSMLINGSAFAGLLWLGSRVVEEIKKEEDALEVAVNLAAPPPPPPPLPAATRRSRRRRLRR